MKTPIHVLIVESNPLMTPAYKEVFQKMEEEGEQSFRVHQATGFKAALYELEQYHPHTRPLNLLILDLQLKPVPELKLFSGQDLVPMARKKFPQLKIMVPSLLSNNYLTFHIFKEINPDGFIVKSEMPPSLLTRSIRQVLNDPPFYSKSVVKALRSYVAYDFKIDKIDRELLYHLSLGAKTKELVKMLFISRAVVERRKKHLKEIFCSHGNTDKELIEKVKELGFI